jgi:hypothetical protein
MAVLRGREERKEGGSEGLPTSTVFHLRTEDVSRENLRRYRGKGKGSFQSNFSCCFHHSYPQVVLSVLVLNFAFEFPNGPSTKLESHYLRPKVAGEEGPKVPVLVRRVM